MTRGRVSIRRLIDPAALAVEHDVFVAAGYIEANAGRRVHEYDRFPEFELFVAYDGRVPVGVTRVITDRHATSALAMRVPTIADFSLDESARRVLSTLDPARVFEVATMAVVPGYRDGTVSARLIRSVMLRGWWRGTWYALASLDESYRRALAQRYPMRVLGPTTFYMGSPTTPVLFDSHAFTGSTGTVFRVIRQLKRLQPRG